MQFEALLKQVDEWLGKDKDASACANEEDDVADVDDAEGGFGENMAPVGNALKKKEKMKNKKRGKQQQQKIVSSSLGEDNEERGSGFVGDAGAKVDNGDCQ